MIADKIITEIEAYEATGEWHLPFQSALPVNVVSGRPYGGVNVFALLASNKTSPVWGTFVQWQSLGYKVTGGKGCGRAVYSPSFTKKDEQEDGTVIEWQRPAKAYYVFNGDDVTHAETGEAYPYESANVDGRLSEIDAFFESINVTITKSHKASYSPSRDVINMPAFDAFTSAEAYYSTLAHEVIHWTAPRVNRDCADYGTNLQVRAQEELVAELGAVLLCTHLQIPVQNSRNDHYEYIAGWLKPLKEDKTYLRTAIKSATEAVAYVKSLAS